MNKDDLVKALSRGTNPAKSKVSAKPTKPAPPARAVVKAANKVTAKRPAKLAAKPSAKSAAKIPQIAKSGSVVKPAVNGHHRATPASNGSAKAAVKLASSKPPVGKPGSSKSAAPAAPPIKELPARPSGTPTKDRIILAVNDPVLAARDVGHLRPLRPAGRSRAQAGLVRGEAHHPPLRRDQPGHDQHLRNAGPRHPHHGECSNWYINVPQPPRQYRADIGYLSRRGDFFVLARSNVVTPPKAGSSEALDAGWATSIQEGRAHHGDVHRVRVRRRIPN